MTGIGKVETHIGTRTVVVGLSSIPDKAIAKLTDPVVVTIPGQVNTAPVAIFRGTVRVVNNFSMGVIVF